MFIERILYIPGYYYFKSGEHKYIFKNNTYLFSNEENYLDLSEYGDIKLVTCSEYYLIFVCKSDNIYIISRHMDFPTNLTCPLNFNLKISDISCNFDHIAILTQTRECYIYYGSSRPIDNNLLKLDLKNVSKITSGSTYSIFITNDVVNCKNNYKCFGLGNNYYNEFSYNLPQKYISEPMEIKINNEIIEDVYCGEHHTIFITSASNLDKSSGKHLMNIYGSGDNHNYQLGTKIFNNLTGYTLLKIPKNYDVASVINIYCNGNSTLFHMFDGTLYCTGRMLNILKNTANPMKITIDDHDKFTAVSFNYGKLNITTFDGQNYLIGNCEGQSLCFDPALPTKLKFSKEQEIIIKFDDKHKITNGKKFYLNL